MENLNIV